MRRLFAILAVVSLLVAGMLVTLLVARPRGTIWPRDIVAHPVSHSGPWIACWDDGSLAIGIIHPAPDPARHRNWERGFIGYRQAPIYDYFRAQGVELGFVYAVYAPMWMLITLAFLPPSVWMLVQLRERYRVKEGHCSKCGYDLRATPDRCPECGVPVATPNKSID